MTCTLSPKRSPMRLVGAPLDALVVELRAGAAAVLRHRQRAGGAGADQHRRAARQRQRRAAARQQPGEPCSSCLSRRTAGSRCRRTGSAARAGGLPGCARCVLCGTQMWTSSGAEQRGHLAAAVAGERDDAHAELVRGARSPRSRWPSCRWSRSRAARRRAGRARAPAWRKPARRRSRWRSRSASRCRW